MDLLQAHLLQQGYNVLVFPEGTRSRSGKIQKFQRGVGHLALRARVGVLPVYVSAFQALPPGSWYLKSTDVSATVGPFLPYELLERMGEGVSRSDNERLVIALCQRIVEALRDGEAVQVEEYVKELRQKLLAQRPSREKVPAGTGPQSKGKGRP